MQFIEWLKQPHAWAIIALALLLISLTWWDLKHTVLPDVLNFAVFALGVAVAVLSPIWVEGGWLMAVFYAIVGCAAAYAFRSVAYHYYKEEPMGLGDVKFLGAAAAWTGLTGLVSVALIGSIVTLAVILLKSLIVERKLNLHQAVPFGPGLCLGLIMTVVLGPVTNWLSF